MLEWLKNMGKDYPEFWKNYLIKLETPTEKKVVLYLETTGTNPTKDKIIAIGAIAIENNQICIANCLEIELNKADRLDGTRRSSSSTNTKDAGIYLPATKAAQSARKS